MGGSMENRGHSDKGCAADNGLVEMQQKNEINEKRRTIGVLIL
jgi:hypothetical protein